MQTHRTPPKPQVRIGGFPPAALVWLILSISPSDGFGAPADHAPLSARLDRVNAEMERLQQDLFEQDPATFIDPDASGRLESNKDPSGVPASEAYPFALADGLLETRMFAPAERILKETAVRSRHEPSRDEAWFRLQKLYSLKEDAPQSLGAYSKIGGSLPPEFKAPSEYLALNSHLRMGNLPKAAEIFDRMNERSEYYPFAMHSIGLARLRHSREGSAVPAELRRLAGMNPGTDPARAELIHRTRATLGFWLMEKKQPDSALGFFLSVGRDSRYRPMALFGAGRIYFDEGECIRAITVFEELIEQAPGDSYGLEARLYLADCFGKLNAFAKAVERNREALRFYASRREELARHRPGDPGGAPGGRPAAAKDAVPTHPPAEAGERSRLVQMRDEWRRLSARIGRIPSPTIDLRAARAAMDRIGRELDAIARADEAERLAQELSRLDALALRADLSLTRNLLLVQDYGLAP